MFGSHQSRAIRSVQVQASVKVRALPSSATGRKTILNTKKLSYRQDLELRIPAWTL